MGKASIAKSGPRPPLPHLDSKTRARVIGANLRFLRRERFPGWGGQKNFADFLGISPNDLCAYEYARTAPSELRLEDVAGRLGLTPAELMTPLPGVTPLPPDAPIPAKERDWREQADELARDVARLEGGNAVLREQLDERDRRIQLLQEANYILRSLLYSDATPEAATRRRKVLERLSPAMADLIRKHEEF